MTTATALMTDRYLLFPLGDSMYGISIEPIRDIIEMQPVTPVPDMPAYVRGVINLRGMVIPVIDIRLRMGLAERSYDDRTCIVVVQDEADPVGLIVDTVAEVSEIPAERLSTPPQYRSAVGHEHYVEAIARRDEQVCMLLNTARLIERVAETIQEEEV